MLKSSIVIISISMLIFSACFRTVTVPCTTRIIKVPAKVEEVPLLKWPDEPVYRLKELTKDTTDANQKLAIILQANQVTINNLETVLQKTGRVENPPTK